MTNEEIALGVIESAREAGITLTADGDVLCVSYSVEAEPHETISRLIRECRADILAALKEKPT